MIIDPSTGRATVAQTTIRTHPGTAALPVRRGDGFGPEHPGAYAFYPDDTVVLPYLPDPWAIGVSLVGYDVAGNERFAVPALFAGDWPSPAPIRLRLSEGAWGAEFAAGVLEIRLPQGETVRGRLSSIFPERNLDDFAVWQWLPAADRLRLEAAAQQAGHFMLSPFRDVQLTHAVQHPLAEPDMTDVAALRPELGATRVVFRGAINSHARSTGRLDIVGDWTEDIDLPTEDAPRMTARGSQVVNRAVACSFDIRPTENSAQTSGSRGLLKHDLGDTKYRRITYHSVATTRFREFFPPSIVNDPHSIQRTESLTHPDGTVKEALIHDILSSARPAAPDVLYVVPTFRWERNDDTATRRHVRHGGSLRIWLRRPWFSSGDGELLGVVLRNETPMQHRFHPNDTTAALAVREPLVSLGRFNPTSGFTVAERTDNIRQAALLTAAAARDLAVENPSILEGLVAVDQPDRIGILDALDADRALTPYVSEWGLDPVWASAPPSAPPTLATFPAHVGWAAGLTLDELPHAVTVTVAGHVVRYDDHRRLWYCDIDVTPGATYWPFIRLAVARYQPHSLSNCHLSRVIMTDFIQVAPDRTAEVARYGDTVTVTVRGASGYNVVVKDAARTVLDPDPHPPAAGTTMRVTLQRREPGVDSDVAWTRVGSDVPLSADVNGLEVAWTGSVPVAAIAGQDGGHRLLITEVETHYRDLMPSDSPGDSRVPPLRERVVYADTFEL
jgi:hypothetical protein